MAPKRIQIPGFVTSKSTVPRWARVVVKCAVCGKRMSQKQVRGATIYGGCVHVCKKQQER